ncbi:MAG: hypothetical protein FWG04_02590 [Desulfovibrionaceae bacterium]|nr:hypothetical protein [Desulfovibrionaceae bacterium]
MSACYTIPLNPAPQSFGITLAGKEYRLTVRWFDAPEAGWVLDIEEPDRAALIVMGIPLVAGCDLLEQYSYMEFGGELWVEGELPPTLENLGVETELVFIVEESA